MRVPFPIDLSPTSQQALECLEEIPAVQEVILLHVLEVPETMGPGFSEGLRELDREILGKMAARLREGGLKVRVTVEPREGGAVHLTINRGALEKGVHLVIMGSWGERMAAGGVPRQRDRGRGPHHGRATAHRAPGLHPGWTGPADLSSTVTTHVGGG